jgi:hypothetical protein
MIKLCDLPWVNERLTNLRRTIQRRAIVDDPGTRKPKRKEPVVNSPDILWRAIDRTAWLVVQKANWIHKPDAFRRGQEQENETKKRKEKMSTEKHMAPLEHTNFGEEKVMFGDYELRGTRGANGEMLFRLRDADKILQGMVEDAVYKAPKESNPLYAKAKDARDALQELFKGIGGDLGEYQEMMSRAIEEIRQQRFAVVSETSLILKPLREIRQFFLGAEYQTELTRLKEFVELCERLNALKESGFLDRVADTMLTLSVR